MTTFDLIPLQWAWGIVLYWLLLAGASLLARKMPGLVVDLVFPLGALGALTMALVGGSALFLPTSHFILPIGLPDLPFHLRLDALSGFFLFLLGSAALGVSVYAMGYFRSMADDEAGLLALWYHLFLASSWCCWPTMPTPSWWPGSAWRCPPSSSSPPTTATPRSAAPASSTC
jgi:hydrogenase-4 component B